MENYRIMKQLGQGVWSRTYMGQQKDTDQLVAMKKFKANSCDEGVDFKALREIKLLSYLQHEHIIRLVDSFATPDMAVVLVYEYAHTSLDQILRNRDIPLSSPDIKQHIRMLLLAMDACHEKQILHRELNPENMFYLEDGTMKLRGFDLARMHDGKPNTLLSPQAFALWYKPPEVLMRSQHYSFSADMWSVGCIFAELMLRRPFLMGQFTELSQLDKIFKVFGTPNESNWPDYAILPLAWHSTVPVPPVAAVSLDGIFTAAPNDAISLLKSILVLDPSNRLTASQALRHPYFSNEPPPTPKGNLILSSPPPEAN
ncbi:Mitogen-activated protein kinase HOG1 (Fragment) [Seminavis robusta]|uniref:Cyclin-dependent kinase 2 homolog n=1 Tax=Seminavis robusta TaxID=568900 RepID=A0A9N8DV72_9STRA